MYHACSIVIGVLLVLPGAMGQRAKIQREDLPHVLDCLSRKLEPLHYAPPKNSPDGIQVRFLYGVVTKGVDEPNELHLIVAEPAGRRAFFYEVYLDRESGKSKVYIGIMGTLTREAGRWIPEEIPGGVATYKRIEMVANKLQGTAAVDVHRSKTNDDYTCEYTP